jgi:hypothetical protein
VSVFSVHRESATERLGWWFEVEFMRPSDLTFSGEETLPQWAATLVRQLGDGGGSAPPDVLSPVPLLEEVVSIIDGMTRGHEPPQPADRKSLRDELMLACASLGPTTEALHATTLKNFRREAGRLDTKLEKVQSAVPIVPLANVLLDELASADSRACAFEDCVAAFRDGASADECEIRLRQLRSFVQRAGHNWADRAKLVRDALADRISAKVAAGEDPPGDAGAWISPAGMTLEERLELATTILRAEPQRNDAVVWLAYANAAIEPLYLTKGPLEFYDGRIWSAAFAGNWPGNPTWTQPPELADPDAEMFFRGMPDSDFVVVRVALADALAAEAADRARELAAAALALTGWEHEWVLLRGEPTYTTHWFGSTGFLDPRLLPSTSNPLLDPVSSQLATVDEDLLDRLVNDEPAAKELTDDVRWRRDASAAPSRDHRVALYVTLIERIVPAASPKGAQWHEIAGYYLRTLLALDDLSERVRDAGETSVHRRISGAARDTFAYASEIVEHRGRNAFTVHADRVLAHIDDLIAYAEPETMEARMLAEVKERMADGPSALAWFVECEVRFERLLGRARRQRNAITHGTRTVPEVVASIEPFLDRIAGRLIGALHASVAEHAQLATQLERYRAIWQKRKAALGAGGDPATELLPAL